MITGDSTPTAEAVARAIGADDVHAGLLPADKVRVVDELIATYGHVAVVGDGVFQRGFHRFRAGIGVEHMLDALGGDFDQTVCQFKSRRVAHLEGGGIIQFRGLPGNRLGYLRAAMARVAAPQARRAIQHLTAIRGGIMHVFRTDEHARVLLELAVRGERHPKRVQVIRGGFAIKRHSCGLSGSARLRSWHGALFCSRPR